MFPIAVRVARKSQEALDSVPSNSCAPTAGCCPPVPPDHSSFDAQVEEMKKGGVKIRILKPRELEQWKAAIKYQEVQAAWVKEQEGKGMKDVGLVLEKVNAIMNDVMK